MCIRDSLEPEAHLGQPDGGRIPVDAEESTGDQAMHEATVPWPRTMQEIESPHEESAGADGGVADRGVCLLYTSDAAAQRSCVAFGGRRTIQKTNNK